MKVRLIQPKGYSGRGTRIFVEGVEIPGIEEFSATLTSSGTCVSLKLAAAEVEWVNEAPR